MHPESRRSKRQRGSAPANPPVVGQGASKAYNLPWKDDWKNKQHRERASGREWGVQPNPIAVECYVNPMPGAMAADAYCEIYPIPNRPPKEQSNEYGRKSPLQGDLTTEIGGALNGDLTLQYAIRSPRKSKGQLESPWGQPPPKVGRSTRAPRPGNSSGPREADPQGTTRRGPHGGSRVC